MLFFDASKVVDHPSAPATSDLFFENYVDVITADKDGRVSVRLGDICRSHSIWLDPVDSPKELYKWRLRVQKAICWAYANDCVPVMMTLTIFHRWNCLKNLLNVLQRSWDKFLVSGRPATRRREAMVWRVMSAVLKSQSTTAWRTVLTTVSLRQIQAGTPISM